MPDITKAEREGRKALFAEGLKRCSKCLEALPIDRFEPNTRGWMGLRSQCRDCKNVATADYQRRNPEVAARRMRRWCRDNPERAHEIAKRYRDTHPLEERLRSGEYRARAAGLRADRVTPAELRADWIRRGISPDRDAYTGQPLVEGWHIDHAVPLSAPWTPGHVVSNLVPCNADTNTTKARKHWLDYLADRQENAA